MIEGGCLCGRVRYAAEGFREIYMCHCSMCRKTFGGACGAMTLIPAAGFNWLQGQDAIRVYSASSSFSRHFCKDCGSVLPQYVAALDQCWIPAGSLDDDPRVPLVAHIHVDSKAAWDVIGDDLPQFPGPFS
jgi:hypothetical protein